MQTRDLCASFQSIAFSHIDDRLSRAIGYLHDINSPIRTVVVVGGVAANQELRRVLRDVTNRANAELLAHKPGTPQWEVAFPPPSLCTDNGVMVAWAGVELFQAGISNDRQADTHPIARWPIGTPLSEEEKSQFRKRSKSFLTRRLARYR